MYLGICACALIVAKVTEFLYDDKVEEELSDDKDPHGVSTFVPGVARKLTEQENIRKSIGERQSEPTIPWPENHTSSDFARHNCAKRSTP